MATYKKGFKKQNSEMLLLKTIVVIIVSVILIVAVAFIYDSITRWKNYNSYTFVEDYKDAFVMKDDDGNAISDYVIYVYSNTCQNCTNIKSDVLRIGNRLNRGDDMFFLLNVSSVKGDSGAFLTTIQQSQIATPMLVVVSGGTFTEIVTGSSSVVSLLEQIRDGLYLPFNE